MPDAGPRLELQQSQRLLMTPMMQQAVQILQMSALQLEQYLQQEMRENPVLEEAAEADLEEAPEADSETAEERSEEAPVDAAAEGGSEEADEAPGIDGVDWTDVFNTAEGLGHRSVRGGEDEEEGSTERVAVVQPSLHDHLHWQLRLATDDEATLAAGARILGQIDSDGYFRTSLDDLAASTRPPLPREAFERALRLIRSFEPAGVGASDLRDCLLIQIRRYGEEDSWAEAIVREYLEDLEKNRLPQIAKALGVRLDTVKAAAAFIARLNPKPGRLYAAEETRYVVPDVFIERVDGAYVVTLNDDWLPRVRLSPYYTRLYDRERRARRDGEVASYLKGKIQAALWLVKSIHQRQSTIYKVTEAIVKFQRGFLDHGIKHLRPLTLRQVAEEIGMHESTVSRVTTGKFAQTPRGTFELKYFFSSGVETETGGEASSKSIKAIIKEIVAGEDPRSPLSDQKIVEVLNARGYQLARRTVTKYREALGILPASRRRAY